MAEEESSEAKEDTTPESEETNVHMKWLTKYDRPMPEEVVRLCQEGECLLCRKRFHRVEDSVTHYESSKHGRKVEQQLGEIYSDGPGESLRHRYNTMAPKLIKDKEHLETSSENVTKEKEEVIDNVKGETSRKRLREEDVKELIEEEKVKEVEGVNKVDEVEEVKEAEPHMRWTKCYDIPLPQEIVNQCTLDHCSLCEVKLSSRSTSQQHYDGSKHAKRVRARLEEWSKGNPELQKPRKKGGGNLVPTMSNQVLTLAQDPRKVEPHWSDLVDLAMLGRHKVPKYADANLAFYSK